MTQHSSSSLTQMPGFIIQTNQKIDTGKTLKLWPIFVDHFIAERANQTQLSLMVIPE
ncbi:hypothetical protein JK621_00505 [Serratia plymuthica]|uniref:hypothetical protein n=1 Tax=Serratia TaxID=613 RepID=UPI001BB06BC7|nr:hypothetical protein [Serratia plymuthica]QUY48716.1 hypothetical protein JK621_00505 [Serratia plymuthica]